MILWYTNNIVSHIAIGLYPPFSLGMNIALNLYNCLTFYISYGYYIRWLNICVSIAINSLQFLFRYFKCIAPIPDGPHPLHFYNYLIVIDTSSYVIKSNACPASVVFVEFTCTFLGSGWYSANSFCYSSKLNGAFLSSRFYHSNSL